MYKRQPISVCIHLGAVEAMPDVFTSFTVRIAYSTASASDIPSARAKSYAVIAVVVLLYRSVLSMGMDRTFRNFAVSPLYCSVDCLAPSNTSRASVSKLSVVT